MPSPYLPLLESVRGRLKPPVLIVFGSPRQVADLAASLDMPAANFQMDLFQAERARQELRETGLDVEVFTFPDLWDLPRKFQTVLFPSQARGDRELKRDMVEQAYHVLEPRGLLAVLSEISKDQFYPDLLKKIYGKVALETSKAGTVLWSPRGSAEKSRRRHEITFHVRMAGETEGDPARSVVFVSQPGVFTYGRMDQGSRALSDSAEIRPGERVLDLGCGTGTVGVLAGLRGGAVTFIDSNVRAIAVARRNAEAAKLANCQFVASAGLEGLAEKSFDVVLANPPYFAQQSIARMFVEGAHRLLKPGGRLVLVTKTADIVGEFIFSTFGEPEFDMCRGYAVFTARKARHRSAR